MTLAPTPRPLKKLTRQATSSPLAAMAAEAFVPMNWPANTWLTKLYSSWMRLASSRGMANETICFQMTPFVSSRVVFATAAYLVTLIKLSR